MKTLFKQFYKKGFTLVFVLVLITLFSTASYSILTKFDNDYAAARRDFDTTSAYYWQESRLRLARYKFGIELVRNGATWDPNAQQSKFQDIINEVFPKKDTLDPTKPFDWRKSLTEPNGGYVSQGTYGGG
jgi:type II secretory pathway pseudopilin PulG